MAEFIELEQIQPENLTISSEGESLKSRTRHYPAHHIQLNGESITTTEEIKQLYTTIGRTLTSPGALAGLINIATLFSAKANKVQHHYKRRWFVVISIICTVGIYLGIITFPILREVAPLGWLFGIFAIVCPMFIWVAAVLIGYCLSLSSCRAILHNKLLAMEQYLSLCEISNHEFDQLFEETDYGVCDYKVVGSAGDGFGFFPSQGSNKHIGEDRSVLTQDIDLNIFMNTLVPSKHNLVSVPGAEGFTWIKLGEEEKEQIKDPVIQASLVSAPDGNGYFLSAARISREAIKYFPKDGGKTNVIEHFPALTVITTAIGPNGTQKYEVDYAFALRYHAWPEAAAEWVSRDRYGIDSKTVELIASRGCYLVHKQCGHDDVPHDHDFDWRYTFASAEADLFHYHRDKRALKLAFVILKFMIKMYMKSPGLVEAMMNQTWIIFLAQIKKNTTDKELPVLRTYHLKTVFLWMAEEETDLDYYTIEGNRTLDEVFLKMLDRYIGCVSSGVLPNYFMRHRNMLSGSRYQKNDFTNAEILLKKIQRRPAAAIQERFERQFVNKKTVMTILIFCLVLYFISQTISSFTGNNGSTSTEIEPTASSGYHYDFSSKYFTSRYLDFLTGLCANTTGCHRQ